MSVSHEPKPSLVTRINDKVANSAVGKYFGLKERNTTFLQELRAGIVCFLTVCYIIRKFRLDAWPTYCELSLLTLPRSRPAAAVNSGILADTGGTCDPAINCNVSGWPAVRALPADPT